MSIDKNTGYHYVVIGGGIVGLSTAWQLKLARPEARIALLEKETDVSQHQTGHNSGVIHAGVYYAPGSLKADFCKRGLEATVAFCQQHQLPYQQCGKLIVACDERELAGLRNLYQRAQQNQLAPIWLDQQQLKEQEPNAEGLAALYFKQTGITDYQKICQKLMELFIELGGEVHFKQHVERIVESDDNVQIVTSKNQFSTQYMIACAGVWADELLKKQQVTPDFKIVPFRGEYFLLSESFNQRFNHLIYPVPDPDLPFLGVHLTKMIDGTVTAGPNAVLALDRENYGRYRISVREAWRLFTSVSVWRMLAANVSAGLFEIRHALSKRQYLKRINKYCAAVNKSDLKSYPAGVRAQAITSTGELIHDFHFYQSARTLHVCNAPSPAATSALPIGEYIVEKVIPIKLNM